MHTPGPWEAPRNGLDGAVYRPGAPQGTLWRICDQIRGQSDEELAGNACLIGAAPELLEALRDFEREISGRFGNDRDMSSDLQRVVFKARAAIAKAEGRE